MEYTREKSVVHVVFLRTTNFSTFLARVHLVNIRATLGLACAQAATLCTQVVGNTRSYLSLLRVRVALNLRSLRIHTPRVCVASWYFNTNQRPVRIIVGGERTR